MMPLVNASPVALQRSSSAKQLTTTDPPLPNLAFAGDRVQIYHAANARNAAARRTIETNALILLEVEARIASRLPALHALTKEELPLIIDSVDLAHIAELIYLANKTWIAGKQGMENSVLRYTQWALDALAASPVSERIAVQVYSDGLRTIDGKRPPGRQARQLPVELRKFKTEFEQWNAAVYGKHPEHYGEVLQNLCTIVASANRQCAKGIPLSALHGDAARYKRAKRRLASFLAEESDHYDEDLAFAYRLRTLIDKRWVASQSSQRCTAAASHAG